jgi:hypothetical protein
MIISLVDPKAHYGTTRAEVRAADSPASGYRGYVGPELEKSSVVVLDEYPPPLYTTDRSAMRGQGMG